VVHARHTDRQTTALVRTDTPLLDPRWTVSGADLEELVLGYMAPPSVPENRHDLTVVPS
jgi:ABC-2 type transport system ATP-binding protein